MSQPLNTTPGAPLSQRKEWSVYARMPVHLVSWLDSEARRQRRSRAFIICQAVEVLRTVRAALDQEQRT